MRNRNFILIFTALVGMATCPKAVFSQNTTSPQQPLKLSYYSRFTDSETTRDMTPAKPATEAENQLDGQAQLPANLPPAPGAVAEHSPVYDLEPSCLADPTCLPDCGLEEDFRLFRKGSRLKFSGFVDSGLHTNAFGATTRYFPDGDGMDYNSGNGPVFMPAQSSTSFGMRQLFGSLEREMDCSNGLDWGFRSDIMYGTWGYDIQSYGDETFDYGWGQGDYGFGIFQLYGEVGYGRLSAKYGKFGTPIGLESTDSWDNFFDSRSLIFNLEPTTHTGALAAFELTDNLTLSGGWTAGIDSGFTNRYRDNALLAGLDWTLSDKSSAYYYISTGRLENGFDKDGDPRFDPGITHTDYFIHSLVFEHALTERLTWAVQYNLTNYNASNGERASAYGINNHLICRFNDKWALGLRAEWMRDNGILAYENAAGDSVNSDYLELTLGLNFNPTEHLRIRPEIRYDHSYKNAIFNYGTKYEQLSGGFAVLYGF